MSDIQAAMDWLDCFDDDSGYARALKVEIDRLRAVNAELVAALEIVARAELYDLSTGIIDADVLEAVQENARAALTKAKE